MKYLIFLIPLFYKFFSNLYYLYRITKIEQDYQNWIKDKTKTRFISETKELLFLLNKAKIQDKFLRPEKALMEYNDRIYEPLSIKQNFLSNRKSVNIEVTYMIFSCIGSFRLEVFNCFNPIYWLEIILFLPKHLLEYLGISSKTFIFKILNIFITFFFWLTGIFFTLFQQEIKTFISSYFP